MKKLFFLIFLLLSVPHFASATAYYIDQSAACAQNGTATTTPFCSIDMFTEISRSAGDIAFVRGGVSTTTGMTDVTFLSDGTQASPIILTKDYDNLWGDFSSSTQTATIVSGSSTITMSASTTGIVAGNWIYVQGDCGETYNNTSYNYCEDRYEVQSLNSSTINLYRPYKGRNAGSGLTLRVMPQNAIRGLTNSDFQVQYLNTTDWVLDGLYIRGTDTNASLFLQGNSRVEGVYHWISEGDGVSSGGIRITAPLGRVFIHDCRTFNNTNSLDLSGGTAEPVNVRNCYFDGNNAATSAGIGIIDADGMFVQVSDSIFTRHLTADINNAATLNFNEDTLVLRNVRLLSFQKITLANTTLGLGLRVFYQDKEGVIGDNQFLMMGYGQTNGSSTVIQSTSTLRSGGGPNSLLVLPGTKITTRETNNIPLFEYPIYTDTTSKTYSVYFSDATSTTQWTANPTASQLYIECEFWDFPASGTSTRRIKRSTGTIDFAGSSAWQALSVTCQPTQTGILYLRGWYGKPEETGKTNQFLMDTTPTII